jgi:6-phospho-beta-glucosidase
MRVTILGGGGFRVPLIARQLAASGLPVSRLALYDTDPGRLAVMAGVLGGDAVLAGAGGSGGSGGARGSGGSGGLPVTGFSGLDEALRGADVIFCALRPGGLDGRVRDERSALELGVLGQETVGAGGLASAARTVPVADAIARRIAELAPDAWVISMTNPAGIVTEVMAAVLGARVIGVCDSPVGLIRRACAAAGVDPGPTLGAVTDRVDADYLGINHLGWLRALRADGTDLLPGLLRDPGRLRLTEEGRLFGADLVLSLGAIPNEYLYWYYAGREALRDVLAAGRTRGEHVRARQQAFYAAAAAALSGDAGLAGGGPADGGPAGGGSADEGPAGEGPVGGGPAAAARLWQAANDERNRSYFAELRTGENAGERDSGDVAAGGYESVAIALASALLGGPAGRLILNVRNGGTVTALPPDMVLEVPCLVDAGGAVPLPVSAPSAHQLGLMSVVRASERDIADAVLIASRRVAEQETAADARERAEALALRAFASHPLVGSLDAARALAAAALPEVLLPTASPHIEFSYRYSSILARLRGCRTNAVDRPGAQGARRADLVRRGLGRPTWCAGGSRRTRCKIVERLTIGAVRLGSAHDHLVEIHGVTAAITAVTPWIFSILAVLVGYLGCLPRGHARDDWLEGGRGPVGRWPLGRDVRRSRGRGPPFL